MFRCLRLSVSVSLLVGYLAMFTSSVAAQAPSELEEVARQDALDLRVTAELTAVDPQTV